MATILDTLVVNLVFKGDQEAVKRFDQGVKNLNKRLDTLSRNFTIAGGVLSASLFGVGRTILAFETAQNQLQATLGATDEAMASVRDQAKELGATTAFSASQVSEAQNQIAQQTGDINAVLAATPDALRLAAAGNLSMAEAAQLVTGTLNAYQLGIAESARVTDVMAEAARSGATTVGEMAPALRQVASIAAQLGLTVEDTAAMLVQLRNNMLRPEQAGTALRAVLSRLLNIAGPAAEALGDIGVDPAQIQSLARLGEVDQIFEILNDAGLDAATSMKLFGEEAGAAGTILAGSLSKIDDLRDRLLSAEGAAARMAEVQQKGVVGAINNFKSALEGLQIELGESGLTGWIQAVTEKLIDFIRWLKETDSWVKTTIAAVFVAGPVLLGLAAAAKIVSFSLGGLTVIVRAANGVVWLWRNALLATRIQMFLLAVQTKLSTIATWLNTTATTANTGTLWGRIAALLASRAAILAGVVATGAATAAQWALNTAMYANPIGLIIAAVIALAAGLFFLVKKVDVVRNAFVVAFNWVKDNWPLLLAIITGPVGLAVYAFVKFKDDIIGVFASVKDYIVGVWQSIWDFILGIINRIKKAPAELLESLPGGKLLQKALVALPGFAAGGVVPGPVGRAQAAIVHGGEMVLPQPFAENMQRLLDGGVSALVGPAPGMATAGVGGGTVIHEDNRTFDFSIAEGAVVVHAAPGQDAAEIGEVVSQKLRAEIRAAYRAFDSGIHR